MAARRIVLLLIFAASEVSAADQTWLIQAREHALARALQSQDKTALLEVLDDDFRVSLQEGTAVRMFSAEVSRSDWVTHLTSLRLDAYEAAIANISAEDGFATALVNETWHIHTTNGRRIEKHFASLDTWRKEQGIWKLVRRFSHSNPP